ncbi:AAA family ATPase [Ectobacillus ponti]|uniref:ATP-binding protein n=1 Tax=Ectobacillus ponti TaxID=2961894 RepID=A0AA42BPQ3_9BACI|nr:ATP-binding protein [Ectobacillus ponti]MCP8968997.1 ATP-binding protein [Ectobacillus ponti]
MKADLVVSLIKAKADGDEKAFSRIVAQIAANEASSGHVKIANDIKKLFEKLNSSPVRNSAGEVQSTIVPIAKPTGDMANLLHASYPREKFKQMVLSEENHTSLERILEEQYHRKAFASYGLTPRRKFLLVGPPGSGKTMTAKMLAGEIGLPLFVVKLEGLLSKYMGETLVHLTEIFKSMSKFPGVYLFDEFDSIGTYRGDSRDIGEVRRILSTFLQLIENDESPSIIVAATNYEHVLDDALFRRFDDVLEFSLPDSTLAEKFLRKKFKEYTSLKVDVDYKKVASLAEQLSFADIEVACKDAVKMAIMSGSYSINNEAITETVTKRKNVASKLKMYRE